MRECQQHVSSREFMEWVAFDAIEPIGSRTTPDLLALLATMYFNTHRSQHVRAALPQDFLPDAMLARRLSASEEHERTARIGADYRRLREERLAKIGDKQNGS